MDRTKGSNNQEHFEEDLPNSAPHVPMEKCALIALFERKKERQEEKKILLHVVPQQGDKPYYISIYVLQSPWRCSRVTRGWEPWRRESPSSYSKHRRRKDLGLEEEAGDNKFCLLEALGASCSQVTFLPWPAQGSRRCGPSQCPAVLPALWHFLYCKSWQQKASVWSRTHSRAGG